MYVNHPKETRRKENRVESKPDTHNLFSSGDWVTLPNKETFQIPELEVKRETSRPGTRSSGEETKLGFVSDDEFSHFSFPTIGFCDITKKEICPNRPQIVDLCKEDKQRIAQLVKEITRCREENKEKTLQVKCLTEENIELKSRISRMEKEMISLQATVNYSDENFKMLSKSFAAKELNFKKKNLELQSSVTALMDERNSLQFKIEEEHKQIEKLSRAIYNVSMENKMVNKKYDHTKEKLKAALETVSKIESEYEQRNNVTRENRSSQTDLVCVKTTSPRKSYHRKRDDIRFHRGSTWRPDQSSRESSDEDSLLSELFFIPKQKNLFKSQYMSDDEFY